MLFNSFEFIFFFLPFAVLCYSLLLRAGQNSLAMAWLIGCSLFFYAWGNPWNLPVLLGSLLFNCMVARGLGAPPNPGGAAPSRGRKLLFISGIAANLLLLCVFKYTNFFLANLFALSGEPFTPLSIGLPLGISFFTLQQVMYLVDCYEGLIKPNTFRNHLLFASFFPTVSMGPITRARDLLDQFGKGGPRGPNADQLSRAMLLFSMGLAKKAIIADSFGKLADAGYSSPATLSMAEAWVSAVSYSLQLYFDFSGYSDMAVAIGLALGITLPANFNSPYRARSIVDFWKRWHITLSNFITTYLYTPIVRSFKKLTFAKAMWATFIAMVIAGFWHGPSWNYIVFGALHGLGLVVNQVWKKNKMPKLPTPLAWTLTFAYVNFAFIFFRAGTLGEALQVLHSMGGMGSLLGRETFSQTIRGSEWLKMALPLLLGLLLLFSKRNSNQVVADFTPTRQTLGWAAAAMIFSLLYLNSTAGREFVYVNF